jgi:hypothetical protein
MDLPAAPVFACPAGQVETNAQQMTLYWLSAASDATDFFYDKWEISQPASLHLYAGLDQAQVSQSIAAFSRCSLQA